MISSNTLSKKQTIVTCDSWQVTHDMWHMVEGENSLKIPAPQFLRFELDSVWKILNKRITQLVNQGQTVLATPGLFKTNMTCKYFINAE